MAARPAYAAAIEQACRFTSSEPHGSKCERCWNYSTHVGESADYPTVCERCVAALE